jgi:hypothetical protein
MAYAEESAAGFPVEREPTDLRDMATHSTIDAHDPSRGRRRQEPVNLSTK